MKIGEMKDMVCIVCPVGCRLTLEYMKETPIALDAFEVKGNKCKRGKRIRH